MLSAVGELTVELVRRPSITPSDAGCLDVLGQRLAQLGFKLQRLPRGEVDNLLAIRGDNGPCLAFAGHTDVVPTGDLAAWRTPPFAAHIEGDMLRGRGAADMKGSLAAMIVAVEQFAQKHGDAPGRIAFLLTSDEEGPATDGTIYLTEYLREHDIAIDWCVVGEPSSRDTLGDLVRVGRRGSLNGRLKVHGVQGHVAYPELVTNPIHRALPALQALSSREWDQGNEYYPPTSFQISNINAGTGAENVVPAVLEAWFNFRYSTVHSAESLQAAVHQAFAQLELDYEIDWRLSGQPFLTAGGPLVDAVSQSIEELLSRKPELSTGGGTSDGRFIAPLGIDVVELGPNNATIHKINECVSLAELDQLALVYERIIERMLLDT